MNTYYICIYKSISKGLILLATGNWDTTAKIASVYSVANQNKGCILIGIEEAPAVDNLCPQPSNASKHDIFVLIKLIF